MKRPPEYFRAGAGAAIVNDRGQVLAFERADVPGAWQLPQGGLKKDEEPLAAAYREVREETGIRKRLLELLATAPTPLAYELPPEFRNRKAGRGQVQYWFLFRFLGEDSDIDIDAGGEFRSWRWMEFDTLVESVAEFRKPVYMSLAGTLTSASGAVQLRRPGQ